ncbi:translation initiation factor eIF-2B subunit alpha [Plasmodium brasilianum]|uniref:Translation initiation factor eIF2B subunit alpha n=2 Tax=Plasmodium (Plasmodium) TaxID=418103 RepID=A0A1D3JLG1_PLAMA|nr:translation initiation factor eIF-2B subunit alpha, putative [Plasmodium malariae]KAI4839945.1 translation initiation factor eIF-2B subunit alpha [Plasmodium brasilianum]SBT87313.1 translation initiation factor eIF-2B subunit alpha, putative [Plasmodium malariae]
MDQYGNDLNKNDLLEEHEVVRSFKKYYFVDKDEMHIAAIKSIANVIKSSLTKTNFELFISLNEAKFKLNNFIKDSESQKVIISEPHSKRMTIYPIISSCDIYHHFVVKKYTYNENNFSDLKNIMSTSASEFPKSLEKSLSIIGNSSHIMFSNKKTVILTHSNSECVKSLLINVVKNQNKQISVYFTTTENICNNYFEKDKKFDDKFIEDLKKERINVRKIDINKVKNIFNIIDFVVIGTELVIDNGGIISKKGIKLLSTLCLLNKKEFYVACEAYKFLKIEKIENYSQEFYAYCTKNVSNENNNLYEFVPHHLITLFYTDIGIFPPSAVSYELNKIYINDAFSF